MFNQFVIVDNGLEANLARNSRDFNESLTAKGTLDRLPEDLSFTIVRGFQIHDFLHVLTGFSSAPVAELRERVGIDPTLHGTF